MPSDHATAAFAIAFGVLVFLNRAAGIALVPVAILIGFARVWTGLHYPGDILAAAVIAALSAGFVYVVRRGPDSAHFQVASVTNSRRESR
jgi:undecaprenyl-diphosphatase